MSPSVVGKDLCDRNALSVQICLFFLAFPTVVLSTTDSVAQSIYRPLGLQRGDEYRIAFVTDNTHDALSGDIAVYNAFVTQEANAPGSLVSELGADWFAIASTSQIDAIANTSSDPSPPGDTGVPVFLVNGSSRIAENYDILWDGLLEHGIGLTQFGISKTFGDYVWTGSNTSGVAFEDSQGNGPLGSDFPGLGIALAWNPRWVAHGDSRPASNTQLLYAISSVLIAVPEPTTCTLALAAICLAMKRNHFP